MTDQMKAHGVRRRVHGGKPVLYGFPPAFNDASANITKTYGFKGLANRRGVGCSKEKRSRVVYLARCEGSCDQQHVIEGPSCRF